MSDLSYLLNFEDAHGAGYAFNCNAEGEIVVLEHSGPRMNPWAWANLHWAIDGYLNGDLSMTIQECASRYVGDHGRYAYSGGR